MSSDTLEELKRANNYTLALKQDCIESDDSGSVYDTVAMVCRLFDVIAGFFTDDTVLVPVPGSSLTQPHTLQPPKSLANALIKKGFGSSVVSCLSRNKPVIKSAHAMTKRDRPTPQLHCDTITAERMMTKPKQILLVDDIITLGSTFLGAACSLRELYPDVEIKAFAAMRTIWPIHKFKNKVDPCVGHICLQSDGYSRIET